MGAFWDGVLAGYGIAIPVGAIAILIVDIGLRRGLGHSLMAGLGAAAADFLYAALAAIAGEALASALAPYAAGLRLGSGLLLLAMGGYGLRRAGRSSRRPSPAQSVARNNGRLQTFTQFLGLTLLNPMTIAYFGALILSRESGAAATLAQRTAFVLGAGLASLSWQSFLAITGAIAGRRLSPRFQQAATLVGNLVVFGLGLRILLQLR